jgi:phage terminase small subunit
VADASALTPNQERFVAEYLVDLNATQAAIRAGYSAKTASQQGARLLGNAKVAAAIAERQAARAERTGITQERVLEELALLAFSDLEHYEVADNGEVTLAPGAPRGAMRALSSIKRRISTDKDGSVTREVELKLWDKPGPLKLAGRHVGLRAFMDRLEVTGKDGDPIAFTLDLETRERGSAE